MKKKILSVVLALTMIVGSCQIVGASPLSNAKSGLNTTNEKISSIERKQSALQSEINALDSELVSLLVDIDVINGEISSKEKELKKACLLYTSVARVLGLDTYSRTDFLLNEKNEIFCLEANTLPGMTPTSLLPQEAQAVGMTFEQLCEQLIQISLKKYQ